MDKKIDFPLKSEYPSYAEMYMELVQKDGTLLYQLKTNFERTKVFVSTLSKEKLERTYVRGKWTIKEILVHIIDDERIYAYRAMVFARNDKTLLPGFAQDDYARFSEAHTRSIENIMAEYEAVRRATIALFDGFSEKALRRIGTADGNRASVRALGYHIAGHELHHIKTIREKYLNID